MVLVKRRSGTGRIRESYSHRERALSTIERKEVTKLKRAITFLMVKAKLEIDDSLDDISDEAKNQILSVADRLRSILYVDEVPRTRTEHISKCFDDFTAAECWQRFRTRRVDLPRLLAAFRLNLPEGQFFSADNGMKFTGQEILLIGLHR